MSKEKFINILKAPYYFVWVGYTFLSVAPWRKF